MGERARQPEPSPGEQIRSLDEQELSVLRQVGQHWDAAVGDGREAFRTLPVDPELGSYRREPGPTRWGRLAWVELFHHEREDELVATEPAMTAGARPARWLATLRHLVLGPPLHSSALVQERMPKLIALPVLASDLLSSVAYGPEAMLSVLALAGSAALGLSLPVAAALVVLMVAAGLSYRQTLPAYPHGAGSYIVASDNFGPKAGLAAAAGLVTDYVLTVSVSVASGVDAVTSALPAVRPASLVLGLVVIGVLLAANLRGVRQAGRVFAAPTYAFVVGLGALVCWGLIQVAGRGFTVAAPPASPPLESLNMLLVLRAFSSGATSMTGIEAVSNAIPAFQPTGWRNARTTLTWMIGLLVTMFSGLVALIHLDGVVPSPQETVLSQLGRQVFGSGPAYGYLQTTTALILLLAANTSFNDFPRLMFFVARDRYAPRAFLRMGDRLTFSNGSILLAVASAAIFAAFGGRTEALIPLYAVGVFLAFTLSQSGMVAHWWRGRGRHWRKSAAFNALGAALSALVLVTAAVTKFIDGAWVVVAGCALLVLLGVRIHRHYDEVQRAVSLHPLPPGAPHGHTPRTVRSSTPARSHTQEEREESPEEIEHLTVVPVARMDLAALRALAYGASLGQPMMAVHISPDADDAKRFRDQWQAWGDHVSVEIISSPYRSIVAPLAHYLKALHAQRTELVLTVVVPEIVVNRTWHELLHSHTGSRLRRILRRIPGVIVATVPIHLRE